MWQLKNYFIEVRLSNWSLEQQYFKDGYRLFGDYVRDKGFTQRNASKSSNISKDTYLMFVWED